MDLGAHVGFFTELMAARGVNVVAFEPHPVNYAKLVKRCGHLRNVTLVNAAAWSSDGRRRLHECPANDGAHSLFKHGQCSEVTYEVEACDIGAWLARAEFAPDFVKIDTEGAEAEIMASLVGGGIVVDMAVETHDGNLYQRCAAIARAAGLEWFPEIEHIGLCYASLRPMKDC